MSKNRVAAAATLVALGLLLAWAIATRPSVPRPSDGPPGAAPAATPLPDPLTAATLREMVGEHHIDAGAAPGHAFCAVRQGNRVEVTLSQELLDALGPHALATLDLPDRTATLTWSRYLRLLADMHDLLVEQEGGEPHEAHDHK